MFKELYYFCVKVHLHRHCINTEDMLEMVPDPSLFLHIKCLPKTNSWWTFYALLRGQGSCHMNQWIWAL